MLYVCISFEYFVFPHLVKFQLILKIKFQEPRQEPRTSCHEQFLLFLALSFGLSDMRLRDKYAFLKLKMAGGRGGGVLSMILSRKA